MSMGANEFYLERYLAKEESDAEKYPVCEGCGKTIYDEYYWDISGTIFCEDCLNEWYRMNTDDYTERYK